MPESEFIARAIETILEENQVLGKEIKRKLDKHQNGFMMARGELERIRLQLAAIGMLARQAHSANVKLEAELVEQRAQSLNIRKGGDAWT